MEQEIITTAASGPTMASALIDYGAIGVICVFLGWQHLQMVKRQQADQVAAQERADAMVARFGEQLTDMADRYQSREDEIRKRYDSVIAGLNADREQLKTEIISGVGAITTKMDQGFTALQSSLATLADLLQAELQRRADR